MVTKIAIVGGNGSGKTTLGAMLCKELHYKHMDIEDYYFEDAEVPYSRPRTYQEVVRLMEQDADRNPNFVISAVNADLGEKINSRYQCILYLRVPLELRMKRVKQRSYDKFADRVLPGGDMYEQEQDFIKMIETKTMKKTDEWLQRMSCPVLRLDGAKPLEETIRLLLPQLAQL